MDRNIMLVVQYDGTEFRGWQRQPGVRTVQGELERVLNRLAAVPVRVTGAGRTDSGVHARGQVAAVQLPVKWSAEEARRAMNALLPGDVWVAESREVAPNFHPRFSAVSREYSYTVGVDGGGRSPFRRRFEWPLDRQPDLALLDTAATAVLGTHRFFGFAVKGTAPDGDDHRCTVVRSEWRAADGALRYLIEADRFLHHMVRYLVGTMMAIALGERDPADMERLLGATENSGVSPPAPPSGLVLERVSYPPHLLTPPR